MKVVKPPNTWSHLFGTCYTSQPTSAATATRRKRKDKEVNRALILQTGRRAQELHGKFYRLSLTIAFFYLNILANCGSLGHLFKR